jgi:hypothetical protein
MEQNFMATLNGFSVSVPQAQEETSEGYIVMRHGDTFKLRLSNRHKFAGSCRPADAEVYVQDKYCGTFRVPYGQTITLERPLNDTGKFTAYRNGTAEATQAEIDPDDSDNGLIKVVWEPGYKYEFPVVHTTYLRCPSWPDYNDNSNHYNDGGYVITYGDNTTYGNNTTCNYTTMRSCTCSNTNSGNLVGGGVGLSGESRQSFSETAELVHDECCTVIYLRIAFTNDEPRPINSMRAVVYKVETNIPRPLR